MPSQNRSRCTLALVLALSAGPAGAAERLAQDWPEASRKAAEAVADKYGAPQEQTATLLIWHRNGPWIRTVVHKVGAEHDFPAKHSDVLEQSLPYKVPLNLFSAVATFNGSVIPDRTRGTLTAYGASEAENVLSLNLARAVVRGELTAEQARDKEVAAAQQLANGQVPDLAAKLTLDQQQEGDVSDPDTAMILPPSRTR
ncbi:hypothetical protein GOFOIKOB_2982 [Methylobacterium tardum]|uniref:Uncharacterized protein n=1 Tax=Methylobacterium tardum TaxID=374432 RepID=A0AA37TB33_9HYPH|nr:hypothetical protein [Methylobacterium tardum]URD38329.1 hypothetical protein M6G65_07755 [Methylobacterium tardum]GJE49941.1 hypothetical protein GOFOIKOB_2982 [Methylobacterium tardum]GLS70146.1 hypothetical protein GCM10007890_21590 [Methylobacterium tardum]